MAKLTRKKLEAVLSNRLCLKAPQFLLEKTGGRLVGDIVSASFRGRRDYERQKMIWDALEAEFGAEAATLVGMLLAYTPEEWNLGADEAAATPKRKKVG